MAVDSSAMRSPSLSPGSAALADEAPPNGTPQGPESTPDRPVTPPQPTPAQLPAMPKTPDTSVHMPAFRTPVNSGPDAGPDAASVYLSSPIRRARHTNLLAGVTMTPGRPYMRQGPPQSPFKATRPAGGGRVNLSSPQSVPSVPMQSFFMTTEQASEIQNVDAAKEALVKSIEQGDVFRKSSQQLRVIANQAIFQHKLLAIERDETEQRFEVESSIHRKEIEKLVVDIMGYSDKSMNIDQIRRRLKRTKQRLKEMEELVALRDRHIAELQGQVAHYQIQQQAQFQHFHAQQQAHQQAQQQAQAQVQQQQEHSQHQPQPQQQAQPQAPLPQNTIPQPSAPAQSVPASQQPSTAGSENGKPRPPPINTEISPAPSSEPLSALEMLASQVLSSEIQRPRQSASMPAPVPAASVQPPSAPQPYGSSPFSSPYYSPFSPYAAVPPQYYRPAPVSQPQFGSPEKRRRPSSSSTISAPSDDDTLEDAQLS